MSRFEYEGEADYNNAFELWQTAATAALRGKPGQRVLKDLKRALEAMPEKRLIDTHLCKDGEVCAIGALAVYRYTRLGHERPLATQLVEAEYRHAAQKQGYQLEYEAPDEWVTTGYAEAALGLRKTLAYTIANENDEGGIPGETPEQRWERVYAWTKHQLGLTEEVASVRP